MDMLTGTISDYDPNALVGLIDADGGRLILFNLTSCSTNWTRVSTLN